MTFRCLPVRWGTLVVVVLASVSLALAGKTTPDPVDLDHLPDFASGVREYPTPFLAIGRTPHIIEAPNGGMGIQSDVGFLGGFAGFVDEATGQLGFPYYRNHAIANFAFDNDKLVIQSEIPLPDGRSIRASETGDLMQDDIFELLIEPRDSEGHSKGKVYRVIGNVAGRFQADIDLQGVGQFHQPWDSGIHYGSMMWEPTGSWMASVAIPWDKIGGKPADGDIWGVQYAVRYADPKVVAYLSPTDNFTDTSRFARLRFDFDRRLNFRAHWMTEEAKTGTFVQGYLMANGDDKPDNVEVDVDLYKGDKKSQHADFHASVPPGATYWADNQRIYLGSNPASPEDRDTVGHVMAYDRTRNALIYDQWVPYWQPKRGERDWLKEWMGRDFRFSIGPYPSMGIFDYEIDAQTLAEVNTKARKYEVVVTADGKELHRDSQDLPKDGHVKSSINLGTFTDGTTYVLTATIEAADGTSINQKTEKWTRHVMPFEKAEKAGLSDIVIPPFTPPTIDGTAVSCWNRTYKHGPDGLLESLVAADQDLLAAPASFKAVLADGKTVTLSGDAPQLSPHGAGKVDYAQNFHGGGVDLKITGVFDYDGFYQFAATYSSAGDPVSIKELRLEIPLKNEHATLIDAAVDWMHPGWEKSLGFLDMKNGRLWDSKSLPYDAGQRTSNLPPYVWIGDDDRGLCFSQPSTEGTHDDDKLPAAALDRTSQAATLSIWLVNKPMQLTSAQTFNFALQASPFKPLPANAHLWRDQWRPGGTYKNGVYFTNFWNPANFPTYGRWLTLDYLKKEAALDNCDRTGMEASSLSECSGTPEYEQFYYEWGSGMDQFKRYIQPVPKDIMQRFIDAGIPEQANPFVMVEAFSNTCATNRDYRVWWLSEAAKHAGVSYIYQDNAPWVYTDRPMPQYGFKREDGGIEPTSLIWNSRTLMKRFATAVTEAGQPPQPAIWPNIISPAVPGRSFCGKGLTGEYTNSDQLRMGMLRVHLSKQWGMVMDWLCQEPSSAGAQIGVTRTYWRALYSQLCLLDVTNISRMDSAEVGNRWWNALDLFWLDDPSVKWHPYYKNPTLDSVRFPDTTCVSTYTANGRILAVVSNQGSFTAEEFVRFKNLDQFGAKGIKYFYNAETGEEIETAPSGALKLLVPSRDYRIVIGFPEPWQFAARNRLPSPDDIPAQSTLDSRVTLGAICKGLLTSPTIADVPDAHQLTLVWAQQVMKDLMSRKDVAYFDANAMSGIDLGQPHVKCSVLYDHPRDTILIAYYNDSNQERVLNASVRDRISARVGKHSFNYVYDVIGGESQWEEIDLPAHGGRWELCNADSNDYYSRRGYGPGTWMSNLHAALEARKAQMDQ